MDTTNNNTSISATGTTDDVEIDKILITIEADLQELKRRVDCLVDFWKVKFKENEKRIK